jgi:transcriptional regulator with XRE-family HTH domain
MSALAGYARQKPKVVDLKAARLDRGLSVADAADQMSVHPRTLYRAEKGAGGVPLAKTAYRIANFYGFKPSEVWR